MIPKRLVSLLLREILPALSPEMAAETKDAVEKLSRLSSKDPVFMEQLVFQAKSILVWIRDYPEVGEKK